MRPYLQLFYYFIQSDLPVVKSQFANLMEDLIQQITRNNSKYFQVMEVCIDFVWKLYTTVPDCQKWFIDNKDRWQSLVQWNDKNREPPSLIQNQYGQMMYSQSNTKMNKTRNGILNYRRNDSRQN